MKLRFRLFIKKNINKICLNMILKILEYFKEKLGE